MAFDRVELNWWMVMLVLGRTGAMRRGDAGGGAARSGREWWPRLGEFRADAPPAGVGGAPVRTLQADMTDDTTLRTTLADADVVLNTVSPYYCFGLTAP